MHAWPFLLRRIRLEALSYRRRMPEKRNTSKHTKCVDNFFYGKSASGREAGFLRPVRAPDGTGFDAADRSAWTYAWSRSSAEATTAVIAGAVPGRSGRRSRDNTLYEREVVNVFRHKSSARSFCASSSAEERNRVKGRPRPGASGPLTRRRVQYAGAGWRARVFALASLQAILIAYLPPPTFAAIRSASLWSEAGSSRA